MAVILGDGIVGMKGGPGLMFVYLVNVFNAMPGGRIVGMIFYICVLFAGVSSIVNLYEAPVAFLQEKLHTNRVLSVVIIGAVGGVIALCIQPWTSQWMDVVSIYICPLGALLGHEEGHRSGGCPRGPHRRQEGHRWLVLSSGQVGVLRSLSGGPDFGRHLRRHRLSLYTI